MSCSDEGIRLSTVLGLAQDMSKKLIWGGMILGSTVGNMLPMLWGGDAMSMTGLLLSAIGGIVGIWAGYRIGQSYF